MAIKFVVALAFVFLLTYVEAPWWVHLGLPLLTVVIYIIGLGDGAQISLLDDDTDVK